MAYPTANDIAHRALDDTSLVHGAYYGSSGASLGGSRSDCCCYCGGGDCGGGGNGCGEAILAVVVIGIALLGTVAYGSVSSHYMNEHDQHDRISTEGRSKEEQNIIGRYRAYYMQQGLMAGAAAVACLVISLAALAALYGMAKAPNERGFIDGAWRLAKWGTFGVSGLTIAMVLRGLLWQIFDRQFNRSDANKILASGPSALPVASAPVWTGTYAR